MAQAGVDDVVLERGRCRPVVSEGMAGPEGRELLWGRMDAPSLRPNVNVVATAMRSAMGAVKVARNRTGRLEVAVVPNLTVACGAAVGPAPRGTGSSGTTTPGPVRPSAPRAGLRRIRHRLLPAGALSPRRQRVPGEPVALPRYRDARTWRDALTLASLRTEPIFGQFDVETVEAELTGRAKPAVSIGNRNLSAARGGGKMNSDSTPPSPRGSPLAGSRSALHLMTALIQDRYHRYRVTVDR